MKQRGWTVLIGAIVVAGLTLATAWLPVPYIVIGPGKTVDTLSQDNGKDIISTNGLHASTSSGRLSLTTIASYSGISLGDAFRAWWSDDLAVVPRQLLYSPGKSDEQVEKDNEQDFVDSEKAAVHAALLELGYGQVAVAQVSDSGAAAKILKPKDIITAINGTSVTSAKQLTDAIKNSQGAVSLTYRRDKTSQTVSIIPQASNGARAIGISIQQQFNAPFSAGISLEGIGGPSAGLMFSLGVIDKALPEDLTGGRFIAGTGTIDSDGKVGPIGGIRMKIIGARRDGATEFLVPADNCAEAVQSPHKGLRLIKVSTVHEAVAALKNLRSGSSNIPTCS